MVEVDQAIAARIRHGEDLDQHRHLGFGAHGDRKPRQGAAPGAECEQQQIVTLFDVRALVGDHGRELGRAQPVEQPLREHGERADPRGRQ